jgi:PAS domain S-box-containing protein
VSVDDPGYVLHVEDDDRFRQLAAKLLQSVDVPLDVAGVRDGDAALDHLEDQAVDCIVCDYDLPGMDGLEVLDAVREDHPQLPFILFTGKGSEEVATEALRAGATDYIQKAGSRDVFERLAHRVERAVEAERRRRRLAEHDAAADRHETLLEGALDALGDVFYVVDEDGCIERWNNEMAEVTGYSDDEIEGMRATAFFPPEHQDRIQEAIETTFEEGEVKVEAPVLTKDGERIPHEFSGTVLEDPDGEPQGLVGIGRDVSDRRERERKLRETMRRLETVLDTAHAGIYIKGAEGRYQIANRRAREQFGLDPGAEVQGLTDHDLLPEELADQCVEGDRRVLERGETVESEETLEPPDGDTETYLTVKSPLVDEEGEVYGLCGVTTDITDRKRRERELETRKRRLETLASNLPGMLYRCRNEPGWPMAEAAGEVEDLTGHEPEDLAAGAVSYGDDVIHPEDQEQVWAEVQQALETGDPFEFEYRIRRADGETRWVWERGRADEDASGTTVLEGFITDVTERKELEEEFRRKQTRLQEAQRVAGVGSWAWKVGDEEVIWSRETYRIFGRDPDELETPTFEAWLAGVHPADRERVRTIVEDALETGTFEPFEHRVKRPDGSVRWIASRGEVETAEGEPVRVAGTVQDITDRKEREQELELKTRAMDEAPVGITITEETGDDAPVLYANERLLEMTGYDEEEVLGRDLRFLQCEATNDAKVREMREAIQAGESITVELENERADGTRFWNRMSIAPVTDETGEQTHAIGFQQDVTDVRETRERLAERQQQLDTLLETAPAVLFATDAEGTFTLSTGRGLDALGLDPGEVVGLHVSDVYGEHTEIMASLQEALDGETVENRVEVDGRWWESRYVPRTAKDGSVEGVVGVSVDVTRWVEAEQELKQSEAALRRIHAVTADPDRSFDEKVHELLQLGRDRLGLPLAYLTHIDPDREVQLVRAAQGDHPELEQGARCPLDEAYCRHVLDRAETVQVADVHETEFPGEEAYARFGVDTYLGAPVTVAGEVVGTLCFAGREPREDSFRDVETVLVELMAQWIGYALEQRRTERSLRAKNERLEEFAQVVSHDLRNPLSIATANLDLATGELEENEHLETVREAHDRMERLIEDLLRLAREGETVEDPAPVQLGEVAEACWYNVDTRQASLRTDGSLELVADRDRLAQLLENLYRNAVEHGGRSTAVTVGALDDARGFFVEDDGPGVPEEERDRIFDAGYTTEPGGTGFGLSIVHRVAEAHGWAVEFTEAADGGARFEVRGVPAP